MQIQLKKHHERYAKYKHSGLPWFGEVPESWQVAGMLKFCKSRVDYRGKTPEKVENGVFLVTAKNIKGGKIDYAISQEYVKEEDYKEIMQRGLPKNGDILFTTEAPLGEVAIVDREDVALAQRIIKFRTIQQKLNSFYLRYWIISSLFQSHLQSLATGSTALGIKASKLHNLRVILPPLVEQRAIVEYLDGKSVFIDRIIEAKQRQIDLLKERRLALINEAVTRGIHEGVEMKNSGIEWIGKVPKNWRIERLKRLGKSIIGLTYSPEDVCDENGTLVLRSSNVQNGEIVFDDNVFVSKKIPAKLQTKIGDILICSRNGSRALIGKNACIDSKSSGLTFGAFMTIFRSKHWRFLSYVFKSSLFNGQSESFLTSTINQLTIDNLNNMVVVLPDTDAEQEKIVKYLEFETNKITFALKRIEKSIAFLQEYRTSLISSVVTGKVKVSNLDKND